MHQPTAVWCHSKATSAHHMWEARAGYRALEFQERGNRGIFTYIAKSSSLVGAGDIMSRLNIFQVKYFQGPSSEGTERN